MRFARSRSTVCLAALAYLLATALSGLMHDHGHAAGEVHAGDPAGIKSEADTGHDADHGEPATPVSDDDCAACRFVTQSAVVVVAAPAAGLTPIVAELRVSAPSFFIESIRLCGLARAPPLG
jgi:hypothetical protein